MRRLVAGLFVLLVAAPAAAQVTYGTEVHNKDALGASATLAIGTIDCSGANTACISALAWRQDAGQTFTNFTHTGSTFTSLVSTNCQGGGCFVMQATCNGGGSGTFNGTISAAGNTIFGGVTKVTGVDCAGTPFGTPVCTDSSGGAATTTTTSVTTTANGMAVDAIYLRDEGSSNTPGAGQTQRWTTSDPGSMGLFGSTKPHTATSLSWTWTTDGSLNFVHCVVPVNAAGGGGGGGSPHRMTTLGVGEAQ